MALNAKQQAILLQALTDAAGGPDKLAAFLFLQLLKPRAAQLVVAADAVAILRTKMTANSAAVDPAGVTAKAAIATDIVDLDGIAANI